MNRDWRRVALAAILAALPALVLAQSTRWRPCAVTNPLIGLN